MAKLLKSKIIPYSKSTRDNHIDHRVRLDDNANTISCGHGGGNQSTLNLVKHVYDDGTQKFRRLTVNETERLMSWPTDWTKYGTNSNDEKYELPVSARYRATGNGIVSVVSKIILNKLVKTSYDTKIRIFSTFSGVDGSTMFLDKKLYKKIGFSEYDPKGSQQHAANVLKFRYPDVVNFGDITKIQPEEVPQFDLMFASCPCQAFSSAGKRLGLEDTRGTLFNDVVRILKDHPECEYLFFENVKGILDHDEGRTFKTILKSFSDIGFHLDFEVCNSKDFGVPQSRERLYLFGRRFINNEQNESLELQESSKDTEKSVCDKKDDTTPFPSTPSVIRLKTEISKNMPDVNLFDFEIPKNCLDCYIYEISELLDSEYDSKLLIKEHVAIDVLSKGMAGKSNITLKTPKK